MSNYVLLLSVSSAALRGADAATQARVWQWASWADSELLPASCAWVFPYLGIMQFNKQVHIQFFAAVYESDLIK